jgi:hypothetical protein
MLLLSQGYASLKDWLTRLQSVMLSSIDSRLNDDCFVALRMILQSLPRNFEDESKLLTFSAAVA